jgi:hypothetical protein
LVRPSPHAKRVLDPQNRPAFIVIRLCKHIVRESRSKLRFTGHARVAGARHAMRADTLSERRTFGRARLGRGLLRA